MKRSAFVASSFLLLGALACGHSNSAPPPSDDADADTRPPTPPEWDRSVDRPEDAVAAASRASCTYSRGALAAETLGKGSPVGDDIPIKNVVVLMQENRSFDSYFGHLAKFAKRDIESAPEDASNPGADGKAHPYQHAPHLCFLDTAHSWASTHAEIDDGKMDGFYTANLEATADGERALWWYDERDLPFYYTLASTFAIADHYHASVPGPTWPNRMFLMAATSFGWTHNEIPDLSSYPFPDNDASIFDELEKRHVDWNLYTNGPVPAAIVYGTTVVTRWGRNPVHRFEEFLAQAQAGTLPQVAIVDAKGPTNASGAGQDEHPPADIQVGQKFGSDVVHALFASPQWKTSALFITYDEHGGLYDHVVPPAACAPDATPPKLSAGDPPGGFDRLGVRVPLTVVSPFAKKGYVGHATYDHTSITRFIEAKFRVPALSARDANADPLFDLFDFANPPFLDPPSIPEPSIEPTELAACQQQYGK